VVVLLLVGRLHHGRQPLLLLVVVVLLLLRLRHGRRPLLLLLLLLLVVVRLQLVLVLVLVLVIDGLAAATTFLVSPARCPGRRKLPPSPPCH